MSMSPAAVLKKARELISDEKAWTKGAYARNDRGISISPLSDGAVCFCSVGALHRVAGSDCAEAFRGAFNRLDAICALGAMSFNDAKHRTHAEVLAAFDKAIASAEAGGGE